MKKKTGKSKTIREFVKMRPAEEILASLPKSVPVELIELLIDIRGKLHNIENHCENIDVYTEDLDHMRRNPYSSD